MARIRNVVLEMGRKASGLEFARVTGSLDFTSHEVQENLNYAVWVAINEQDDKTIYHFYTNGQAKPEVLKTLQGGFPGSLDDDVRQFFLGQTIRPDGRSTRPINIPEQVFDVGDQEDDNEEYIATVFAIPEITHGYGLSNIVSINLG